MICFFGTTPLLLAIITKLSCKVYPCWIKYMGQQCFQRHIFTESGLPYKIAFIFYWGEKESLHPCYKNMLSDQFIHFTVVYSKPQGTAYLNGGTSVYTNSRSHRREWGNACGPLGKDDPELVNKKETRKIVCVVWFHLCRPGKKRFHIFVSCQIIHSPLKKPRASTIGCCGREGRCPRGRGDECRVLVQNQIRRMCYSLSSHPLKQTLSKHLL